MRIHTDNLTATHLYSAALISRARLDLTMHGSKSRARAFEVRLTGESRRRPNSGTRGAGDDYAATWDQWGVFLAVLFEADPDMVVPYYASPEDYAAQTGDRFGAPEAVMGTRHGEPSMVDKFVSYGWPEDAHGDHVFRFAGTPSEQSCTKCSAVKRWGMCAEQYMSV